MKVPSHEILKKIDYSCRVMKDGWNLHKIEIVLLSLTLLFLALVGARAHAATRMSVLESLKGWRQQVESRTDLPPREKDLRLDFVDRLLFQTERKYKEGNLKEFLQKTLEEMADTDEMAANQSFGSMSEFLLNLQDALRDLLEQNENPIEFLRAFTNYSGLTNPKTADEFAETRSYYDGKHLSAAHPMSLDQAAEVVEQKEKEAADARQALESTIFHRELLEQAQFYPVQIL